MILAAITMMTIITLKPEVPACISPLKLRDPVQCLVLITCLERFTKARLRKILPARIFCLRTVEWGRQMTTKSALPLVLIYLVVHNFFLFLRQNHAGDLYLRA
jgi:hypothetical protein